MALHKLTPRYLNSDDDVRLVKSTEMTDALNVRISSDDEGDAFVIKNAYGNDEITLDTALPAGTNKVIGSVANDQKNSIFYFVWNSNNDHTIYRYSATKDAAYQVYKDSVLGFTENTFVKANIVTSLDGDELVYFSAADSSPKKINASKALRGGYPSQFTSGTDEEKLLYLTTAKQPPLDPPTYSIVNNGNLKENRISDKVFQFAYRYIYQDGEISALSPYSSLTTSVAQLRDGFNTQEAKDFYNQINVFVKNTVADVDKIQVFAREGNDGTFYEISEINNSFNTNAVTVGFSNQFKGGALSTIDKNKLFDNVPQLADSQEIVDGRLMYGGYTEGYPNFLDVNDVALVANYKDTETIYDITLTATSSGTSGGKTILDFNDLDDFPTTFTEESTIYLNVNFSGDAVTFNGGSGTNDPLSFSGVKVVITDLDGSNAKQVTLSETDDPVSFIPSGIFISEMISIPSGTSKLGAMNAIRSRLTSKKYNLMLAPTRDQNVVFTTSGSAFTDFTAQVSGRAVIEPKYLSSYKIELDVSELEMYIGGVSSPVNNQNLLKAILTGNQDVILKNIAAEGGFKDAAAVFFEGGKERSVVAAGIISVTQSDGLNYEFTQPSVIGTSFTSASVDSSDKSFKSGSSHKMGIVYYDSRNRSGGVQELGDVYINSLNNRADENDLYGAASIVMRLPDKAPDWASRWAPVYQGRGSSRLKIMYSIDGAFIPYRTNSSLRNSTNNNRIYLSLNSVFKRSIGYNDAAGADLKYAFQKGDRLRVLDYDGGNKLSDEFVVLGYETLGQDDDNPILDTSAERTVERTTGNFLVIEEKPGISGFTSTSIINRDTNWNKRCVIEIYNSEIDDSEIYYEIGKSYPVSSGVHSGERDATTLNLTVSTSSGDTISGTSEYKLFKGDILTVGSNTITITNSYVRKNVNYFFATDKSASPLAVGSYTGATVNNPEKVVDINLGDVYFRKRSLFTSIANEKLITGQKSNIPTIGIVRYIEDYSVSDFFTSESSSIGRSLAPIPDAKTVKRSGSITYSEPYLYEGTFNGLSSFNLSLSNFMDLDYEYGSIKGLEGYNQRLYFIQEGRAGVIAVNRNVIQASSGDNLVALSNNVLQSEQYYVGEYGTSHSESVSSRDGMVYFVDVKKGRVLRIDSQGITIISDANMSSYFNSKFDVITKYSPTSVVGGIDVDNDEYILSSNTITEAQVAINTDEYVYTTQLDGSGTKVLAPVAINNSAVFSFNTEERTFDAICDQFEDSLQAIAYLDEIEDGGSIFIDSSGVESATLYGVATNSNFDFFVAITVDPLAGTFVFNNAYCASDDTGSINSSGVVLSAFTIAYGTNDKAWTTRYSFTPESIVSLNSNMYTFKSGKIYKHSEDADRNTYYGGAVAESIVEAVSNREPSAIKSFESLSLEGDATWQVVATTTNQTATLAGTVYNPDTAPSGVWTEKEGFYYASIHGDTTSHGSSITSVTSTSEIFALGNVASDVVGGNSVTFDSAINTMPFPLGSTATVYKLNGSQLDSLSVYPLSITAEKTLTLSGNVTVSDGDLLVVVGNSSIEGDQIRDYYIQLKLTKTTSSPIELYAINTVFADSKLHN